MAGAQRTIVKRVIVGTPIRSVRASGSDLNFAGDSGTGLVSVGSAQILTFDGVAPLTAKVGVVDNRTVTFTADNATDSSVGVAKFDADHFTVSGDGNVRINMLDSSDQVTHSLIPNADSALDLGSATNKWRKLYLSGQTIQLGTIALEESDGGFAVKTTSGDPAALSLAGNTTNDLAEGSNNLYYTRARVDSALGDAVSTATIRSYFQAIDAAGDGTFTYDSATGTFTYSGLSTAQVRGYFQVLDQGGDGSLSYDSATGNITYTGPSATEVRAHFQALDLGGDGSFSYDSATGNFSYTGPSASEVRAHLVAGTGVTYESSGGVISIGQPVGISDNVTFNSAYFSSGVTVHGNLTVDGTTTTVNSTVVNIADKNITLADSAADLTALNGAGITLGGASITTPPEMKYVTSGDLINFNRAVDVDGAVTADSATFTNITRSGATSYAGTWGSASLVPIVTLDASGFVDSIGTVSVAGVSSTLWDSSTAQLVINTADGGIFRTTINGFGDDQRLYFGDANEASIRHTTGGTTVIEAGATELDLDGAGHFLIKNNVGGAKIAEFTPFAGVDLYYGSVKKLETTLTGTTVTGTLNADSATVTNLTADSAVVTNISGTSANYSSVNATTGTISQLDVDSAHIGIIDNNTINTNSLNADSAIVTDISGVTSNYATAHAAALTADSASVTNISGTSANYTTVNATTGTISQFSADSAHIGIIDNNTLNTNALDADSANITNVSGSSANYSTGNFTTLTAAGLTVNGNITGTGNTYIAGNLTVQGTTTTVNSTEVTINDKNIVLADSAVNNVDIDGAGLTIGGALYTGGTKPTITYTSTDDRWALNKALNVSGAVTADSATVTNLTADSAVITDISGVTSNYATVHAAALTADSAIVTDISGATLNYGTGHISQFDADSARVQTLNTHTLSRSNTTVIAGAYGSASLVPVVTVDASGFVDSIGTVSVAGVSSTSWDSSVGVFTINTVDGGSFSTPIRGFGDNVSLAFGDNDDAIINRNPVNLVIKDSTGGIYIEAQDIYLSSKNNGNPIWLQAGADDGVKINDSSGDLRLQTVSTGTKVYGSLTGATTVSSTNLEADSADIQIISGSIASYGSLLGDSATISQLSVDSAHIGIIDNNTLRTNSLDADSASLTNVSGSSANYSTVNATTGTISQLDVDSAHIQTLNTHTLTRSNTTVTAGVYGSASLVPIVTVDGSGFVDSIGTVSVAGVSSTSWDSASTTFTINTADGGSYPTIINGFGILQADSASITNISGTSANYSTVNATTGTISQLSVDSAHIGIIDNNTLNTNALNADSAIATNISGVSLNYGTGHISQLTVDSATITSFQADSATVGEIQFQLGWADSHIGFREGALWYDPFHKNLNYYTDFDHPIEIGMQEVERVYNNTGVEIAKGKPLYYSGNFVNDSGRESPTIALADATDAAKYNVQGLSAEAIPNNSYGQIVVSGVIDGIDTSSLTAGQNFFAGLTPGALQNAAPAYPNFPMCLGWVIKSDPNNGKVIINQQNHSVAGFRVQSAAHIGGDLTIDGNLNVTGTQTITSTANVEIGGNFQYLNAGDTIGEAGTSFVGTGLDDAFYSGHYSGDEATKSFFVKIDATGTPDTFEWGFDSSVGTEATGIAITGAAQILDSAYGIEIDFGATTGHTVGDKWTGTATATDIDTGFFSNRNDSAYTHVGLYFDVSENKWTFLNRYDPEPDAPIDPNSAGTQYGVVKATTFEGNLSGNVTGNVTGSLTGNASTATTLATGRNFSASGDATAPNVSFNGSAPVDLVLTLATVNGNVGSFGSSSQVPAITVNGKGLVTAVTATNIDHDALTNFVSNEHIDHTSVSITAGTGLTGGGTIAATRDLAIDSAEFLAYFEGSINHDNLSGFVANEHIDHTSVSITAGTGLTGGGTIASTRDLAIDSAEFLAYFEGSINHDNLSGFVADEHIDHSSVSITAGTGLTGGGTIASTRDLAIDSAEFLAYFESSINHDNLTGFVADEHIDHSTVSITAGTGLTGGGTIASTRDLAIDSAQLTSYFGATIFTDIKTRDGAGSGLDADTLDGQQGTYYRINVYNAAGSLLN